MGQPERADRQIHLRQAGHAGGAGEPHHARAEQVHLLGRAFDRRRETGRGRQRHDGAGLGGLQDVRVCVLLHLARRRRLLGGDARRVFHALAGAGADGRAVARDEIAEGLPHLVALNDAEGLAPGIEAFQRNARMRDRRQVLDHEFERGAQQVGDVGVALGKGVFEHDQPLERRRYAAIIEQNGTDIAEHAGTRREPARHVEGLGHGLHAGQVDAVVGRPQAVEPVERGGNPH